jgi:glutaredoxin|tara:strand:+ start:1479 stop:1715 length:237 start_codon:yes stop_codon:yes gene_type:complete
MKGTFHIYGNDKCPWCVKSKNLLKATKNKYKTLDPNIIRASSIPQIYHIISKRKIYIGGYEDLLTYLAQNHILKSQNI